MTFCIPVDCLFKFHLYDKQIRKKELQFCKKDEQSWLVRISIDYWLKCQEEEKHLLREHCFKDMNTDYGILEKKYMECLAIMNY